MDTLSGYFQNTGVDDRVTSGRRAHKILLVALLLACLLSITIGPVDVSLWLVLQKLATGQSLTNLEHIIFLDIRLPRLITGICVGSALAVSGAVMQGLFRNPLADPGLVGVSAGAGVGAIIAIVMGGFLPVFINNFFGDYLIILSAFLGGWVSAIVLYRIATHNGQTSVATMLLAGIAIGAFAGAISGVLIYIADDKQLRDLTFWGLGSLASATWGKVMGAGPLILISIAIASTLGRGLNGLALGEATAAHIGISTQRLKNIAVCTVAAATGAAVAISGGIGFIGIVVPHLLRKTIGPDHRTLILNSGFLGAIILILSDMISRVITAPSELPIGIVTAILGAPVFLWILLSKRNASVW
jgi:iron complex transport system permease protein